MKIPLKSKVVSIVLKIIVVAAAALGVILSAQATKHTFMGGGRVFMFFTIQSNIAIAVISAIGAVLLLSDRKIGRAWFAIKFVGTVSITLTGAVFAFVLAPTLGKFAWNVQNTLTHAVVPVAAVIDFFVTGVYGDLRKRSIFSGDAASPCLRDLRGDRFCRRLAIRRRHKLPLLLPQLGQSRGRVRFYKGTAVYGLCVVDPGAAGAAARRRVCVSADR